MVSGTPGESEDDKAERFRRLALPYLDDVYTLSRYLLHNASDADDAVQECYLRAFRHFDGFRGGPIKPWLMAILRNVCHAARAGNARIAYVADSADTKDGEVEPLWHDDHDTPEQAMLRQHDTETVRRLIGELPVEFREVIVLREMNDLSYREIAMIVEAPIGTVMSRLARARRMLRAAWICAEGEGERR